MIRPRPRPSDASRLACACLAPCLGLAVASAAQASVVEALSVAELSARADCVVLGEVTSVATEWSGDHRHLFRRVGVQVSEALKGPAAATVTLVLRGGARDGLSETVLGVPELAVGQRAVFFLRQVGPSHRLVGMGQGVLLRDDAGGLTAQSAGLTLAGVGPEGALRLDPARPTTLGLAELRQQLRAAR